MRNDFSMSANAFACWTVVKRFGHRQVHGLVLDVEVRIPGTQNPLILVDEAIGAYS
ncbi:MAG: hypothetical protein IPJ28_15480 [Betaproteobacteria bacterium]|nr:hypothetical protein [Betaproteobacteria bacterium]